jgi:hypothetical protein
VGIAHLTWVISHANVISATIQQAIDKVILLASRPELKNSLQKAKAQLPDPDEDVSTLTQWWREHGYSWNQQLRNIQIQSLNLGFDWQFSESQIMLLDQYYQANLLLADCLNSDCHVSPYIRDEIERTLLLSIKDIEQDQKNPQAEA